MIKFNMNYICIDTTILLWIAIAYVLVGLVTAFWALSYHWGKNNRFMVLCAGLVTIVVWPLLLVVYLGCIEKDDDKGIDYE